MVHSVSQWQQPWPPPLQGGTTPTCLHPILQMLPKLRMGPSSPPPHHISITPLPLAPTSSPWWQAEQAAVIHAHHQGSCHHAPMPPQALPSCTPLYPVRTKGWVQRWSPVTVVHQQTWLLLKLSGDLTKRAMAEAKGAPTHFVMWCAHWQGWNK